MQFSKDEKLKLIQELCEDHSIAWNSDAKDFLLSGQKMSLEEISAFMLSHVATSEPMVIEQELSIDETYILVNGQAALGLNTYANRLFIAA